MAAYPKKIEAEEIIETVTERYMEEQRATYRERGLDDGVVIVRGLSRQVRILAETLVERINEANHHGNDGMAGTPAAEEA